MALPNHLPIRASMLLLLISVAVGVALPWTGHNLTSPVPPMAEKDAIGGPRIINGVPALPKEFPHQIHLMKLIKKNDPSSGYFSKCGGSIIGKQWVLTAAHCIVNTKETPPLIPPTPQNFAVTFGSNKFVSENPWMFVEKVIVHPTYYTLPKTPDSYDFALLKIKGEFAFNEYTQPIALATSDYRLTGDAILSGWGLTVGDDPKSAPKVLLKVTLPLTEPAACERAFPGKFVPKSMICAVGDPASTVSGCSGDSGGPLIQKRDNKNIQIGVVSFGHTFCQLGVPNIFSRVSAALDWIKKETGLEF